MIHDRPRRSVANRCAQAAPLELTPPPGRATENERPTSRWAPTSIAIDERVPNGSCFSLATTSLRTCPAEVGGSRFLGDLRVPEVVARVGLIAR